MRAFDVVDVPQRSPEWFAARLGRVTGSRAGDYLAKTQKGAWASSRRNYLTELMLERLTGQPQERGYQSQAMRDGQEREVDAVAVYEALTGRLVRTTGFLSHKVLMAGASLDGDIDDFTGILEVKAPLPATHLEYLETGKIPKDYREQIRHGLFISGAQWCDFVSYCPAFEPLGIHVHLVRVERDVTDMLTYENELVQFLAEVDHKTAAVRTMAQTAAVLREAVA